MHCIPTGRIVDIYTEQPENINIGNPGQVVKLYKAAYGLKKTSLVGNKKLDKVLTKSNLQKSQVDLCIYDDA